MRNYSMKILLMACVLCMQGQSLAQVERLFISKNTNYFLILEKYDGFTIYNRSTSRSSAYKKIIRTEDKYVEVYSSNEFPKKMKKTELIEGYGFKEIVDRIDPALLTFIVSLKDSSISRGAICGQAPGFSVTTKSYTGIVHIKYDNDTIYTKEFGCGSAFDKKRLTGLYIDRTLVWKSSETNLYYFYFRNQTPAICISEINTK
jgi:hypothetical protein